MNDEIAVVLFNITVILCIIFVLYFWCLLAESMDDSWRPRGKSNASLDLMEFLFKYSGIGLIIMLFFAIFSKIVS